MNLKRYLSLCLIGGLLSLTLMGAACPGRKKVITDPTSTAPPITINTVVATIKKIQAEAERLPIYTDLAYNSISALKALDVFKSEPELMKYAEKAQAALLKFKATTVPLLKLTGALLDLEKATVDDLLAALKPVKEALNELRPVVADVTGGIFAYLNAKGITSVNVDSLKAQIELGFSFVNAGVELIPTFIKR